MRLHEVNILTCIKNLKNAKTDNGQHSLVKGDSLNKFKTNVVLNFKSK